MCRLVAEGDSWFSLSKVPGKTDVINELKKIKNNGDKLYDVKSVASVGDTISLMAYSEDQFDKFRQQFDQQPPDAILLSGGGNDITGKVLEVMLKYRRSNNYSAQNPFNEAVVKGVIEQHLCGAYLTLLNKINMLCKKKYHDSLSQKIPVFIHSYAYPIPNGEDFGKDWIPGLPGPWLEPAFENKGYADLEAMTAIMQQLINRFDGMLTNFGSNQNRFSHIYVQPVDVRSCLREGTQDEEDYWDDELHPSDDGFELIAGEFDKAIQKATKNPVQISQNT